MGARGPVGSGRPRRLHLVADSVVPADSVAADVAPQAPDKPATMTDEALRALWDEQVPKLDEAGLLAAVDGLTLDLALRHYLAAVKAAEELAKAGSNAIWDDKNKREAKHPADAVFRMQSDLYLKYAAQLGMTFIARARLSGKATSDDTADNPFAASTAAR